MSDNYWYENNQLPPIGSKCKFTGFTEDVVLTHERVAKGQTVEIVCHFDAQACRVAGFIFKGEFGEVFIGQAKHGYFKPIKTDRDIAIDLMVEEIFGYYANPKAAESYIGIARYLYDAGYRKTTND